jgi:hypothetical protein
MNGKKYEELIKAILKEAKAGESERRCLAEKFSLLSQMVFLMATGDLETIFRRQEEFEIKFSKFMKRSLIFGIVLLIGVLAGNATVIKGVISLLVKVF